MKILSTRAGSHHSIPESVTAITVDGRPAVVSQAPSTLLPSTPQSSWGLPDSAGVLDRALVSFWSPPPWLQLAGRCGMAAVGVCGSCTQSASDVPVGGGGHGNSPVGEAVPDPVLGSVGGAGQEAGRLSTTADAVGKVAAGRAAPLPAVPDAEEREGREAAARAATRTTTTAGARRRQRRRAAGYVAPLRTARSPLCIPPPCIVNGTQIGDVLPNDRPPRPLALPSPLPDRPVPSIVSPFMNGGPSAQGDRPLTTELRTLVARRPGRVGAAVVEAGAASSTTYGFLEADPTTRFEVGSVTKALTGMLLATAVGAGEIALESAVADIDPGSAGTEFGTVTVKELCTHTSGLRRLCRGAPTSFRAVRSALLGLDPYRGIPSATLMTLAARQPLHDRGLRRYSNLGAAVLGHLLATLADCDYSSLLRQRVLSPLAMDSTTVASGVDTARPGRSSWGLPRQPWVCDGYAPAGGVVSTIEDLARMAHGLLEGSAPGSGSLDPIEGIVTDRPHRSSGMFWIIDAMPGTGRSIVSHNGRTGGYSSLVVLLPQTRRAVIVLMGSAQRPEHLQNIAFGLLRSAGTGTGSSGIGDP